MDSMCVQCYSCAYLAAITITVISVGVLGGCTAMIHKCGMPFSQSVDNREAFYDGTLPTASSPNTLQRKATFDTVKPVYNSHCISGSPLYNSQVTESQLDLQCAFQPARGRLSITASFLGPKGDHYRQVSLYRYFGRDPGWVLCGYSVTLCIFCSHHNHYSILPSPVICSSGG